MKIRCRKCGASNDRKALFCQNCGTSFEKTWRTMSLGRKIKTCAGCFWMFVLLLWLASRFLSPSNTLAVAALSLIVILAFVIVRRGH
jgi:uncharacterized membrane protein YvbJ